MTKIKNLNRILITKNNNNDKKLSTKKYYLFAAHMSIERILTWKTVHLKNISQFWLHNVIKHFSYAKLTMDYNIISILYYIYVIIQYYFYIRQLTLTH